MEKKDKREGIGVIVAGSRTFDDKDVLYRVLDHILSNYKSEDITIIEGKAKGADRLAGEYARDRGIALIEIPAEWDKYGKSAGYIRNKAMHDKLAEWNKRGCVCFWDGTSRGTAHNFDLAKENNEALVVYDFVKRKYIHPHN